MNKEAHKILTRARVQLIKSQPFWGTLALRLELQEEPGIPTLGVDGRKMYYNPKFVLEELKGDALATAAVAHEVGHCVLDHIGRRGARNHIKWNVAGDYVINDMLKQSGFTIGAQWLHKDNVLPPWLAQAGVDHKTWGVNLTADAIYNKLPDPPEDGGTGGALCEIGDGSKPGDAAAAEASEQLSAEWKLATVQAANYAKQQGNIPGVLERFVSEMINPTEDWRTRLRRFFTETTRDDYSWMRPNKFMVPHGIYLPTLHTEGMGKMRIIVDTSGSIGQRELDIFGAEIQAIRDQAMPRKTEVVYCDARVNHVETFTREDVLKLKGYGGGGTDFRPPFTYAYEDAEPPAAIAYLTDGYGTFPDTPPESPVIWCMTTDVMPPWGERMQIEWDK